MSVRIKFKPKVDKIIETILYLSHKIKGLDQYKTVKLIYLADRAHLNRYGRPITFDRIVAMNFGPVASTAYNILKGEKPDGHKCDLPFKLNKIGPCIFVESPARQINKKLFSKSDLMVIDEIVQKYGAASFKSLYDETHTHFAYSKAWRARGHKKMADMLYEDMIDESSFKKDILEDLEAIAPHM